MEPVTDLAALPVILLLRDMAAIYRVSVGTIRRRLQQGTFSPVPWETYPYRWRREDVELDLLRRRIPPAHKPHGFAARRQKKAALEAPRTRTAS